MTVLLKREARPASEKLREVTNYFATFLSTCEKVTSNLSADRVIELGKRTAGIKSSLSEFAGDSSLMNYAQAQADDSGQYPNPYNLTADYSAIMQSINKVRDAVKLIDLSSTIDWNADSSPSYATLDTSSLLTAVQDYKTLVSNA